MSTTAHSLMRGRYSAASTKRSSSPNSSEKPDAAPEKLAEALERERRTIFVGMTRAMRALLVVIPHNTSSPLLEGFDATHWNFTRTIQR